MAFRYETHMHTRAASACGVSTGAEHVRFYHAMGYQGIIVTDHFFGGNTAVPRELPWRERVERFCAGYEEAAREGERCGLDVFFGWEQNFDGDEYLVYGLDKQWLLAHPEMEHWTRTEQLEGVHRDGGCVIQAHPFRDRPYIQHIYLAHNYADGVEIANSGNHPYNDAYAVRYARTLGLVSTAGSDNHNSAAMDPRRLMGVELPQRLRSIHDYVRLVLERGPIHPIIPNGWLESVQPENAPQLMGNWLDEQERRVPCELDWLRLR